MGGGVAKIERGIPERGKEDKMRGGGFDGGYAGEG